MLFSNPKKIVENLVVQEGSIVADFGAGTGHYTIAFSEKVGASGKVYALESNPDVVERLKNEVSENNSTFNVEIITTSVETNIVEIPQNSCDWVVCANIFFALDHKNQTINVIKNIIKEEGKILLVDWSESFSGMGPSNEDLFTEKDAVSLFEKHGFSVKRRVDAGSHHYGMILSQRGRSEEILAEEDGEEIISIEDID